MIKPFKFVKWKAGEQIKIDNPLFYVKEHFKEDWVKEGIYKLHGWAYDFRPFLKRFVYKQYGSWHEAYSLNKSFLRKSVYGKIDIIQEVTK